MRYLLLIAGAGILALGTAPAQNTSGSGSGSGGSSGQQIPVGQIFKNFIFPNYENGQLTWTLSATQAKGITQNRAETIDLIIKLYDSGALTTVITSPKADLLLADHKMRTKNTVLIVRSDMQASAQTCDFDQTDKKYTLRTNVKVVLKNFDAGKASTPTVDSTPRTTATPAPAPSPAPAPVPKVNANASILDSPGTFSRYQRCSLPQPANDPK